jgi:hypothetical protein
MAAESLSTSLDPALGSPFPLCIVTERDQAHWRRFRIEMATVALAMWGCRHGVLETLKSEQEQQAERKLVTG